VYLKSRRDELTSRSVSPVHSDFLRSGEVDVSSKCERELPSQRRSPPQPVTNASITAVEEVVA
jgi:hypothetical protein